MHRHRVDKLVVEGDVLVFDGQLAGDLAPQPRSGEDVGFVDRGQMLAAVARELEAIAQHTNDLLLGVHTGVDRRAEVAVVAPLGGLAVVDSAGELADDHQVDAIDNLRAQRRRVHQFLDRLDRPQVGEQPQFLA